MKIRTRVFELAPAYGYQNNKELARAMGISEAQVSRVQRGLRGINGTFIAGARRAFPDRTLDELFPSEEKVVA